MMNTNARRRKFVEAGRPSLRRASPSSTQNASCPFSSFARSGVGRQWARGVERRAKQPELLVINSEVRNAVEAVGEGEKKELDPYPSRVPATVGLSAVPHPTCKFPWRLTYFPLRWIVTGQPRSVTSKLRCRSVQSCRQKIKWASAHFFASFLLISFVTCFTSPIPSRDGIPGLSSAATNSTGRTRLLMRCLHGARQEHTVPNPRPPLVAAALHHHSS
jgi:hypothetical protein